MFEEVVRRRRVLRFGSREVSVEWRVEMGVSAGRGRDRVGGRFRPGKEVRRMLTVCVDIFAIDSLSLVVIIGDECKWICRRFAFSW